MHHTPHAFNEAPQNKIVFYHPEPSHVKKKIIPIFLPFAGCPQRCIFCSQEKQTGQSKDSSKDLISLFKEKTASLHETNQHKNMYEIAFYGGTFTMLPESIQLELLELCAKLKEDGILSSVRCSTRPDAVSLEKILKLKQIGLDCIELGIQSFSTFALRSSNRGYTREQAIEGCQTVKEAGIDLGIQLLPGMPGHTPIDFFQDIELTIKLSPVYARLYPCLVFKDTDLALHWEKKKFEPWSLELVEATLPKAILALWQNNIKIIRMGLAPQDGMDDAILAGATHPALGQKLRSHVLYELIKSKLISMPVTKEFKLTAPKRYQGELFGHAGHYKQEYSTLGLSSKNISWHDDPSFILAVL